MLPIRGRRAIELAKDRVWVFLLIGAVAVVATMGLMGRWWESGRAEGLVSGSSRVRVGSLAPDFKLIDINTGQNITLSEMRGKPVWISFWATWCPACKEEMAKIKEYYEIYKSKDLVIIGVDVQESESTVRDYVMQYGLGWNFVIDSYGAVTDWYLVDGIPRHFFVDGAGVIQAIHVGGIQDSSGGNVALDEYLGRIMK